MAELLQGVSVALLVEDLYHELEFWCPYYRLVEEGARVTVLAPEKKEYTSKLGYPVQADKAVAQARVEDFHGLVIPGGYAPDKMRQCQPLVDFVKAMDQKGGVIAQICHGGWVPISAGILQGRRCTSYKAIRDDMVNAGGLWEDSPVVVEANLISSRCPQDLPVFCKALVKALKP